MWRSTLYYGRKGMVVHAISAVDNALWDLVGNALKCPCTTSLEETKSRIPSYCWSLERLRVYGYTKLKLAVPYGPADGLQGMKKNVELVERTRKLLGPSGEIMLDLLFRPIHRNLLTGEPYAGEPHVRFGGRGAG